MKTIQQDHKVMGLLKVNEITRLICETNMGALKLRIRKGENLYRFVLDSVELPLELNKELFELILLREEPKVIDIAPLIERIEKLEQSPKEKPKKKVATKSKA